jgi:hypothetical protein
MSLSCTGYFDVMRSGICSTVTMCENKERTGERGERRGVNDVNTRLRWANYHPIIAPPQLICGHACNASGRRVKESCKGGVN